MPAECKLNQKYPLEVLEDARKRAYRPPKSCPFGQARWHVIRAIRVDMYHVSVQSARPLGWQFSDCPTGVGTGSGKAILTVMGIRRAAQYATFAGAALMVSAGSALAAAAETAAPVVDAAAEVTGGYVPMKPTEGKGMPTPGAIGFQEQFSPIGEYGQWMHNAVLMPIITAISLLVLLLLLWVVVRYRTKANPKPSRTSHNTLIEVVWTLLPVWCFWALRCRRCACWRASTRLRRKVR